MKMFSTLNAVSASLVLAIVTACAPALLAHSSPEKAIEVIRVYLKATHEAALTVVSLEDLKKYAVEE